MSAGASFVRVDLHVHTFPDSDPSEEADLGAYVDTAIQREVAVLAITDHNTVRRVRDALKAAEGKPLLLLPGIEISTHEGHLLALFSPAEVSMLEGFANPANLKLSPGSATEQRSSRSLLDLVGEIASLGGLAIPAHVDAADGIHEGLQPAALAELLKHPGLAAFEFATPEALAEWFTDTDPNPHRLAAWAARQAVEELRERGLARIMSSDAHSVAKLGEDRARRTLTRLRLDDANFEAVTNAIRFNPKARCKAEAILPVSYPRVVSAKFEGGFLDGVTLEFSPNLNCIIGGRGSGKSTALLAIRAALGQETDEDPDDPDRMPAETTVTFVDRAGSVRTAVRKRGEAPVEPATGTRIVLQLADMEQDESGRLARDYNEQPVVLLEFLDSFVSLAGLRDRERQLLSQLGDNASELLRTNVDADEVKKLEVEERQLEETLKAAQTGQVEEIARWAVILASQTPLLQQLEDAVAAAATVVDTTTAIDIDQLAAQFKADLTRKPAVTYVAGDDKLRARLAELHRRRTEILKDTTVTLEGAAEAARTLLGEWKQEHEDMLKRLDAKQRELEQKGLKVQAGAIRDLLEKLNSTKTKLSQLRAKEREHRTARATRDDLRRQLESTWDAIYHTRKQTLKKIATVANAASDELRIFPHFEHYCLDQVWCDWLSSHFPFRSPRVQRLAALISPGAFADKLLKSADDLLTFKDSDGQPFFTGQMLNDALPNIRTWVKLFELHTMRREDRPRVDVQERGTTEPRPFDHLSAGQQRSVLLSIILNAEADDPLVLDQPEDHLDARYIATSVVRHLEGAKERRQLILATHSANLTVLGDAELAIPLRVEAGHGKPLDPGAIDRPATRDQVCSLLEGGVDAYRRRGERYGFRFAGSPAPST